MAAVISVSMKPGATALPGDAARGVLLRQRLGQADEPRLGRGVVRLPGVAHQAGDRAYVDDPPAFRARHLPADRLAGVERALEVDGKHAVEVLLGHLQQQLVAGDACVVDEDVDAAEVLADPAEGFLDERKVGHVAFVGRGADAEGLRFGDPVSAARSSAPAYTTATSAPFSANETAMAAPMPREPPVTTAVLPLRSISYCPFRSFSSCACAACTQSASVSAFSTLKTCASGRMRRIRPDSTLPGRPRRRSRRLRQPYAARFPPSARGFSPARPASRAGRPRRDARSGWRRAAAPGSRSSTLARYAASPSDASVINGE